MQNPKSNSASCETRLKLIEAAGEVFADSGFHNATIRQICERAGANVAAVNYHFRDKAELYDAVLQYSHCAAEAAFAANQPPADAPPEERLQAFIRLTLLRILDEGRPTWHGKLMTREMTEPSAALDKLVQEAIKPRFKKLSGIVAELLGPGADQFTIEKCYNSVIAQCVFYHHCKPLLQRLEPDLSYDREGIETLAQHITRFSLVAIRGFRSELQTTAVAAV
ncbi:MAG: CerR family C-terminal domain-containing protein [Phycisphaerae bacterium]|nr:CerR family C-terminal domain-containing protein [Phycisphaerae bacterium]